MLIIVNLIRQLCGVSLLLYMVVREDSKAMATLCFFGGKFITVACLNMETGW